MSEAHFFKVNANLKDIIGKGLIYSDHVAIIELIKNSKDAKASLVSIEFKNEDTLSSESSILISDNGTGMTLDDIENKWLNIAYSEKKKSKELLAGNKGVGRFGSDRLGKKLELYTKHQNGDYLIVHINWKDFENRNINEKISDIKIKVDIVSKENFIEKLNNISNNIIFDDFVTGTILHIQLLHEIWDTNKLKKLGTELEKFSPCLTNEFEINLHFGKSKIKINNNIFDAINIQSTHIKSEISEDGKYILSSLFSHGELIYEYKVDNPYNLLKNIKTEIHYLDPMVKQRFARRLGVSTLEYGSIFLFYNNYRISPYGNKGNDWLTLDQRKSQGTARYLGTRDLIGKVEILDFNNVFHVLSNREGLAQNNAFNQLISFETKYKITVIIKDKEKETYGYLANIIRQLEQFVTEGLGWSKLIDTEDLTNKKVITVENYLLDNKRYKLKQVNPEHLEIVVKKLLNSDWNITKDNFYINIATLNNISQLIQEKEEKFYNDFKILLNSKGKLDFSDSKSIIKLIEKEKEKTQLAKLQAQKAEKAQIKAEKLHIKTEKENKIIKEKLEKQQLTIEQLTSQNLFLKTTSNIETDKLLWAMHDILNATSIISSVIRDFFKKESKEIMQEKINQISKANQKIYFITKFATMENFNNTTNKIYADLTFFINNFLQEMINVKFYKILIINKLDLQLSANFKFFPIEFMMLIDNIISNSCKAKATELIITNKKIDNKISYSFEDNGHGIVNERYKKNINLIFEKGETTTNGSGLGLYQVSEIIKKYNGEIKANALKTGFKLEVILSCN